MLPPFGNNLGFFITDVRKYNIDKWWRFTFYDWRL